MLTIHFKMSVNNGELANNVHDKKLKDGGIILGSPEIIRLKFTPKQNSLPISVESVNPLLDNLEDRKFPKFRTTLSEPNIFVTPAPSTETSPEHVIVFPKGSNSLIQVNQLYGKYKKKSSQDFSNPAFEPDDGLAEDHHFTDIVEHVLRQPLNGRYVHPYGQGNLYKAILVGEKTKLPQSAGKLVFWTVFLLMMVGIACSIILLAETYKSDQSLLSSSNNTTKRR
ncbi:uncharacterized protein LOC134249182 [Saccostrea cucullata]|uniref:uncharacterized protein LOC134249182 n=1 Tax=Saccostrea cuccullata TaxID=36930 RepID=UPI002ED50609